MSISNRNSDESDAASEAKDSLKTLMKAADISGASIASIDKEGKISTKVIGTEKKSESLIFPETPFGAASLSKPVFAYLVLKLIEDNKTGLLENKLGEFKLPPEAKKFNLDTPLYTIFSKTFGKFHKKDEDRVSQLTARMVLSHTTGLPITHNDPASPMEFQFDPGTQYGYSGPGIAILQEAIESLTKSNLEDLAKEHIFREEALNMPNSSFHHDKSKSPQAANSLYTTPNDYMRFIQAWMNDKTLQHAFKPHLSMKKLFLPSDWLIKDSDVLDVDREHAAWGLGLGLQIDDEGDAISAYHSGDMNEWRAWVAMNLKEKSAIVYFSNSHNGHILAEQIIPPSIKLNHVFNFFFKTYGFARNLDELADEGVEFNNGLRKGCLSKNIPEEKKLHSGESSTSKILSDLPSNPVSEVSIQSSEVQISSLPESNSYYAGSVSKENVVQEGESRKDSEEIYQAPSPHSSKKG